MASTTDSKQNSPPSAAAASTAAPPANAILKAQETARADIRAREAEKARKEHARVLRDMKEEAALVKDDPAKSRQSSLNIARQQMKLDVAENELRGANRAQTEISERHQREQILSGSPVGGGPTSPPQVDSILAPPTTDVREGFLTDEEKRPGGLLRIDTSEGMDGTASKKPNTVRDITRSGDQRASTPAATGSPAPQAQRFAGTTASAAPGRGVASAGSALASLGSQVGGSFRNRLASLKVSQERGRSEVSGELSKLSRTHPPSRFAFTVILLMGVVFDVLNYFVDVGVVVDLILSVVFVLCIRALINRPKGIQRLLGVMILVAVAISTIPIIGSLISGPIFMIVLAFGILNPGVKVGKVDKEQIQKKLKQFEKSIQKARAAVARLTKLGKKTKGLGTLTTKLAKSKVFKSFSKNSKTMSRLVGSAVAEAIPIIAWIPFNTLNVFWTYSDLKKAHLEAKQLLEEYTQQEAASRELETAVLQEEYRAQLAGVAQAEAAQREQDETSADSGPETYSAPTTRFPGAVPANNIPESPQRGTMRDVRTPQPIKPAQIPSPLRRSPVPARA